MDYVIYTCAVSMQGIASFVPLAEAAGSCIAVSEKILRAEDADYIDDRIVERLCFRNPAPEVSSYMFVSGRRPLFSDVMATGVLLFFWTTTNGDGGGAGPGKTTTQNRVQLQLYYASAMAKTVTGVLGHQQQPFPLRLRLFVVRVVDFGRLMLPASRLL